MPRLLFVLSALLVAVSISGPVVDPDLWWHITVGRWIISNGEIPHSDMWGLFSTGEPWRAYSWSSEILFAIVEHLGGISGLLFLQLGFAFLLALSLFFVTYQLSNNAIFGVLLGSYVVAACHAHFTLRPQVLVWVDYCWLFLVLSKLEKKDFGWGPALALIFLGFFWGNTHLTAIIGLVTAFLWSFEINLIAIKKSCLSAGSFLLGTFITPYLGGEWLTFFSKTDHPLKFSSIIEFQPATIWQYSTGFLLLLSIFLAGLLQREKRLMRVGETTLLVLLAVGSLAIVKFMPFYFIAAACSLARIIQIADSEGLTLGPLHQALEKLCQLVRGIFRMRLESGVGMVLVGGIVFNLAPLWREPLDSRIPKEALDFAIEKGLPGPVLTSFGLGGYVLFRNSDENGNVTSKASIDGRTNLIDPALWKAHQAARSGFPGWKSYLEMVKPGYILWQSPSALESLLELEGEYCVVFRGKKLAAIWVKKELASQQGLTCSLS